MTARTADRDALELLNEFGSARPTEFGGIYVRDADIYICFREDLDNLVGAARAYLHERGVTVRNLQGRLCEYSLRELLATAKELSDDLPRLQDGGADVRAVSVDIVRNRVVVSLGREDVAIASELSRAHGDEVIFEVVTAIPWPAEFHQRSSQ